MDWRIFDFSCIISNARSTLSVRHQCELPAAAPGPIGLNPCRFLVDHSSEFQPPPSLRCTLAFRGLPPTLPWSLTP